MKEFNLQKINDDIYLISEPYFYEHANLYLIQQKNQTLLIDCGLGLFNIKTFLQEKGFKPKALLTHSHFDHAGGIKYFLPSEIMATPKIINNLKKKELLGLEYLEAKFFNQDEFKNITPKPIEKIIFEYSIQIPSQLKPFTLDQLSCGEYNFEIMNMPGHTDDSVVLFDAKHKLLITGDALYDGMPYANLKNSNKKYFIRSLQNIKNIDFEMVLPGHNQILNRTEAINIANKWIGQLSD